MEEEDEQDQGVIATHTESGVNTADNRIAPKTKDGYRNAWNQMVKYSTEHGFGELKPPVGIDFVRAFFGSLAIPRDTNELLSDSYVGNFQSALKLAYKQANAEMASEITSFLSDFKRGHKRKIAELKSKGVMKATEGKSAFNFNDLLIILDDAFVLSRDSRYLHVFVILCFSMIARSQTVADLRYDFFSMGTDSIKIKITKHKGDQIGKDIFPKHMYANPYNPKLCLFTALGIHLFTNMSPSNGRIFQDGILKSVGKALTSFLKTDLPGLATGFDPTDHGLHSIRKTAATYSCGFPGGPNLTAVYLRANWSIGGVKDRYINPSEGNDQYLGRILAGLDYNNVNFGALPPHFGEDVSGILEAHVPRWSGLPHSFKTTLPFILASMAHHHEWLNENLNADHPLKFCSL